MTYDPEHNEYYGPPSEDEYAQACESLSRIDSLKVRIMDSVKDIVEQAGFKPSTKDYADFNLWIQDGIDDLLHSEKKRLDATKDEYEEHAHKQILVHHASLMRDRV